AIDVAVAVEIDAHALELAVVVKLPAIRLAVAVGVALDARQLPLGVVLPDVGVAVEVGVELFFDDAAAAERDPGVDAAVVVAVRFLVQAFALFVVRADDVLDAVEVGVDLAAHDDLVQRITAAHHLVDAPHVGLQRAGARRLHHFAIDATAVLAARSIID